MEKTDKNNINKIISIWSKFLDKKTFYVPALGPVLHNGNGDPKEFLFEVLKNSNKNQFLSYDKNKRWFKKKQEKIVLSAINFNNKEIYIPTKDDFRKVFKIFYYSKYIPDNQKIKKAIKIYNEIKKENKNYKLCFCCFKKPKNKTNFISRSIYLKNITDKDKQSKLPKNINYYNKLNSKEKLTFEDFSKGRELEGFDFLWKNFISKEKKIRTIICATLNNKIIGAIGPLDISKDAAGTLFLFPPYFGVSEKIRGKGIGKKLWESAMNFAYKKGAKYVLVQNSPDSIAAKFYESQGLSAETKIYSYLKN